MPAKLKKIERQIFEDGNDDIATAYGFQSFVQYNQQRELVIILTEPNYTGDNNHIEILLRDDSSQWIEASNSS